MTHKVHPKSFRIRDIADWDSRGFYRNFPAELEEDLKIRKYLKNKLGSFGLEKIEIERFPGKTNIIISSMRPGLIIGRGGKGIEDLKKDMEKFLLKKKEMRVEIREVKNPWISAPLVAQWIVQQIEKRMPFRRVLKQSIEKVMAHKEAQGVRVQLSGRLDGNEIARTEWLKKGRMPRQVLRADIDYAIERAYCTYGVVGVKVWIYKGENSKF